MKTKPVSACSIACFLLTVACSVEAPSADTAATNASAVSNVGATNGEEAPLREARTSLASRMQYATNATPIPASARSAIVGTYEITFSGGDPATRRLLIDAFGKDEYVLFQGYAVDLLRYTNGIYLVTSPYTVTRNTAYVIPRSNFRALEYRVFGRKMSAPLTVDATKKANAVAGEGGYTRKDETTFTSLTGYYKRHFSRTNTITDYVQLETRDDGIGCYFNRTYILLTNAEGVYAGEDDDRTHAYFVRPAADYSGIHMNVVSKAEEQRAYYFYHIAKERVTPLFFDAITLWQ